MIRMIFGWTMTGGGRGLRARNHSAHLIREIIVPDGEESRTLASLRDSLLPKLMRGEVRMSAL